MSIPLATDRLGLPEPTTDIKRAQQDLDEYGLCLLAEAMSPDTLASVRARLVEVAAQERADGTAMIDGGGSNQRVWQLLNRGEEFRSLVSHPGVLAIMDNLVGRLPDFMLPAYPEGVPRVLLSNIAANITGPGGEAQPLHPDQAFVPLPWPAIPQIANVAWMLDDYTEANGATMVVPRSHKVEGFPDEKASSCAVPAEAPAGSALIWEGRLWHGTGANTTQDEYRHGILSAYCPPWIRQQENFLMSLKPEVFASASPTLRRLLGFDHYMGWGMIDGNMTGDLATMPEYVRRKLIG